MTSPSREIEFKFGLHDKQAFVQLVAHMNLPEALLNEGVVQVNHFFDSQALCLHKKHFVIRLREEKEKYFLTIKGEQALQQKGGSVLSDRVEEEVSIPRQAAEDLLHGRISPQQAINDHFKTRSASILQMIKTACNDQDLVHIGEFSNVRIHLPPVTLVVANTNEKLVFELDTSTFPDGSVEYEIEIEIAAHSDAANIEAALIELFQHAGIEWHTATSKAARFFATLANS
jgi:uncharacterized protein YjbK